MRWFSGMVVHSMWSMVWLLSKIFISRPVECMNSYKIWIHIYDKFSMNSYTFCTLNIWIHTNMNSYHVCIHIFFAVIMYEFIYFFAVQNKSCERARAASAQRKLRARSASREGEAQAHLLPQPGHARLPQPLGLRAAALIVRVACGCPDS